MGLKNRIDLFDGHCDAVYLRWREGGSLRRNDRQLDLERLGAYRRGAQFFALWCDTAELPGRAPEEILRAQYRLFRRELEENRDVVTLCRTGAEAGAAFAAGKIAAFLSVEGAELLGCGTEGLEEAYALGVRAVNLTWNHANALSGSHLEEPERGLSARGRDFVRRMEALGMLADVSHLSDRGFWDVAELLDGPFFASHSNARSIFFHSRNLTDAQFTAIIDHGGVAGLNLYADFLGERADLDTAIAHLEHWLALGGGASIALGADFDGCGRLPAGIAGVQDMDRLWNRLLQRNYDEALLRALFFENLMRVVNRVCTM